MNWLNWAEVFKNNCSDESVIFILLVMHLRGNSLKISPTSIHLSYPTRFITLPPSASMIKPPYLPLFLTQLKPRKGLESLNYQHSVLPWSMPLRYRFLLKENRPSGDYKLPLSSEQLFLNTSAQLSHLIFYLFCYSYFFFKKIALIFLILPFHSLYNISSPSFS